MKGSTALPTRGRLRDAHVWFPKALQYCWIPALKSSAFSFREVRLSTCSGFRYRKREPLPTPSPPLYAVAYSVLSTVLVGSDFPGAFQGEGHSPWAVRARQGEGLYLGTWVYTRQGEGTPRPGRTGPEVHCAIRLQRTLFRVKGQAAPQAALWATSMPRYLGI